MTDDHIIICPSDPDGETRANEFWRKEDGTIDPCDFWEVSYTYYGWAVRPEFVIDPATDVNADPPTFDPGFMAAVASVFKGEDPITGDDDKNSAVYNYNVGTPWNSFEADLTFTSLLPDLLGVSRTCYRLREGIERFFITDINNPAGSSLAQSEICVMWDSVWTASIIDESYFNHIPGGGNVLYMDGHVEFVRYPGEWPVCKAYVRMMDTLFETIKS